MQTSARPDRSSATATPAHVQPARTSRRRPGLWARSGLALVVAGSMGLASGCVWDQPRFKRTLTASVAHVPGSAVEILARNGSIELRADGGVDVRVTSELALRTQERADAVALSTVRGEDGVLRIGVDWPGGEPISNERAAFVVLVPEVVGGTLATSNGKVHVHGAMGTVQVRTSNGSINVADHDGALKLQTSNGRIEVSNVTGAVEAGTSNGSMKVELTGQNPGPVNLETSNGRVEVILGRGFVGRLTGRTSNGSTSVDIPAEVQPVRRSSGDGRVELELGAAEPASTIKTSNGSLVVRVR